MSDAQKRAFDQHWGRFGIDNDTTPLDLPAVFGNTLPVVLEIGFGMGQSLAQMAGADPTHNFLGIEVHRPGVGRLMRDADAADLARLRLICDDAVQVLTQRIADGALERIQIFFPDPWPKKRHHKRRLLQPSFAALLARKLRPGGILHLATDWEDYATHMMVVLGATPGLINSAGSGNFSPRPDYRPLTKYEARGQRLGHGVFDLIFQRPG